MNYDVRSTKFVVTYYHQNGNICCSQISCIFYTLGFIADGKAAALLL